jgi:outer membrane PBP1 activator LpoA protein
MIRPQRESVAQLRAPPTRPGYRLSPSPARQIKNRRMTIRRQCRRAQTRSAWAHVIALVLIACAHAALSAAQTAPTRSDGATTPPPAPARAAPAIALVLPLTSATYARAAAAVRDGFLAAAAAGGAAPLVISHGDNDVETAFEQARATGVRVIVGPLVRDDVKAIAILGIESPFVLALNQVDEGVVLPPNMFALTLGVESDGRQLARLARDSGAQTVAIISTDSPLQKRFAAAFADNWVLLGGATPVSLHFERAQDMLVLLKRELVRSKVDAALLALDGADAVLVKPYVGTIATYAGSSVNDGQPRETLRELEDVHFVDIPWLATPDAKEFARIARPALSSATLERLYALGIDAFRVAQLLAEGRIDRMEFDGATGHLTLDATRQFVREARALQFKGGQAVPAGGP